MYTKLSVNKSGSTYSETVCVYGGYNICI